MRLLAAFQINVRLTHTVGLVRNAVVGVQLCTLHLVPGNKTITILY